MAPLTTPSSNGNGENTGITSPPTPTPLPPPSTPNTSNYVQNGVRNHFQQNQNRGGMMASPQRLQQLRQYPGSIQNHFYAPTTLIQYGPQANNQHRATGSQTSPRFNPQQTSATPGNGNGHAPLANSSISPIGFDTTGHGSSVRYNYGRPNISIMSTSLYYDSEEDAEENVPSDCSMSGCPVS